MYTQKSIFHLAIRMTAALLASHFIVVQNTEETWLQLFTKGYYYKSVLYSMMIAFLLIEYVYIQTKRVNRRFEGAHLSLSQVKAHVLNGFLSTAMLAFLMAMLLFWLNGQNIFKSSYFENLFPYILIFILCVNTIYFIYFYTQSLPKMRYLIINPNKSKIQNLRSKSINANFPALIYYQDRGCFAIDFNGVKSVWPYKFEETLKLINGNDYFQINRREIVNRAAILSTKSLYPKCKIELSVPYASKLFTSRRKTRHFKDWLDNEMK